MNLFRQRPYVFKATLIVAVLALVTPLDFVQANFLADQMYSLVVAVFGFFVGVAASIFSFGLVEGVIDFGTNFNTGFGVTVNNMWVLMRDLFNLTFIFGLVYIGFQMILNSASGSARQWLVNLIIAALLVNFSLFFTKFVVDVSNIIAVSIINTGMEGDEPVFLPEMYAELSGVGLYERLSNVTVTPIPNTVDMGASAMHIMGMNSVWRGGGGIPDGESALGYIFGTAILFIVTAYVFFAAGLLLIIRAGVLLFMMIFSPVMFLGFVFPGLRDYSKKYWTGFLSRAFFAPILILMMYVSLQLMQDFNADKTIEFADAMTGRGGHDGLGTSFGSFAFAIVFMVGSLMGAQRLGAEGAGMAMSRGRQATNFVRRKTVGGTVAGGRSTASMAYRRGIGESANTTREGLRRNTARLAQGGVASRVVARTIDRTAGAGLGVLGAGAARKQKEKRDRIQTQQQELNALGEKQRRSADLKKATKVAQKADLSTYVGRQERRDAVNTIGSKVRGMSNEEVLQLNQKVLQSPEVAANLTEAHMKALKDSGKFNNKAMNEIGDARKDAALGEASLAFNEAASTADELNKDFKQLGQTLRNMSTDQLAGLGTKRLSKGEVAVHLSDADIQKLEQSGKFGAADIQQIRNSRDTAQSAIASGDAGRMQSSGLGVASNPAITQFTQDRQRDLLTKGRQEVGQMPVDVFASSEMAKHITPNAVAERMRNGVTEAERIEIRDNIDAYIVSTTGTPDQSRVEKQWRNAANRDTYVASLGLVSI